MHVCPRVTHDVGSTPTFIPHVVSLLDKVLYEDYLSLVASNKQHINWEVSMNQGNGQLLKAGSIVFQCRL